MKSIKTSATRQLTVLPASSAVLAQDLALCSTEGARKRVGYREALKWNVLPLSLMNVRGHELLTVAGNFKPGSEVERALQFLTGCTVTAITVSKEEILTDSIFIAYRGEDGSLQEAIQKLSVDDVAQSKEQPLYTAVDDGTVPALVYRLLEYGISKQASDLSLVPERDGHCECRYRIAGAITPISLRGYDLQIHKKVVNRIKVLGKVSVENDWIPIDGMFQLPLPSGNKQIRFHIFPTVYGPKLHCRLPEHFRIPAIAELGLTSKTRNFLEAMVDRVEGAIVLAGPTGSGKTTTAYSVLQTLAENSINIVSLEDPVERELLGVSQTDLSRMQGITYENALKHVLRQDPDVIFVGEVRDSGSSQTALEAAATGHLVVTSVHGGRVLEGIERLNRLSKERELLARGLSLVIAQRLLPRLCSACKVIDLSASRAAGASIHQAVGCPQCSHTGFRGRVLVEESLYFTAEVRDRFIRGTLTREFLVGKRYFQGLEESLQTAILDGLVDVKNAKKVVPFEHD